MTLTLEAGERLLSVAEAAAFLPPRRRLGRVAPPHPRTVRYWIRHGLRGTRLDAVLVSPRTYATTRSACERFSKAVAEARAARRKAAPAASPSNL